MAESDFNCGTSCTACGGYTQGCTNALLERAEKAEAERDRYKSALERIAGYDFSAFAGILGPVDIAKEALAEPPC